MKKLLMLMLFLSCVVGANAMAQNSGIAAPNGWFANELIRKGLGGGEPYRFGVTPEGYDYSIFADGSGSISAGDSKWRVWCRMDIMDDARKCEITNDDDAAILIYFGQDETARAICLVRHDYPGRVGAIRIDKKAPHETNERGCVGTDILSEMQTGETLATRHYKWPNDFAIDRRAALLGLDRAIELLHFIRANIDKMAFRE